MYSLNDYKQKMTGAENNVPPRATRRCMCPLAEACHGMSAAFCVMKDPRGCFVQLPSGHSKEEETYRQMYTRCLSKRSSTHAPSSLQSSGPLFVAVHHFHPQLVDHYLDTGTTASKTSAAETTTTSNTGTTAAWTGSSTDLLPFPTQLLTEKDLDKVGLHETSEQLECGHDCYFRILPNYSFAQAHVDLKTSMRHYLHKMELKQQAKRALRESRRQELRQVLEVSKQKMEASKSRASSSLAASMRRRQPPNVVVQSEPAAFVSPMKEPPSHAKGEERTTAASTTYGDATTATSAVQTPMRPTRLDDGNDQDVFSTPMRPPTRQGSPPQLELNQTFDTAMEEHDEDDNDPYGNCDIDENDDDDDEKRGSVTIYSNEDEVEVMADDPSEESSSSEEEEEEEETETVETEPTRVHKSSLLAGPADANDDDEEDLLLPPPSISSTAGNNAQFKSAWRKQDPPEGQEEESPFPSASLRLFRPQQAEPRTQEASSQVEAESPPAKDPPPPRDDGHDEAYSTSKSAAAISTVSEDDYSRDAPLSELLFSKPDANTEIPKPTVIVETSPEMDDDDDDDDDSEIVVPMEDDDVSEMEDETEEGMVHQHKALHATLTNILSPEPSPSPYNKPFNIKAVYACYFCLALANLQYGRVLNAQKLAEMPIMPEEPISIEFVGDDIGTNMTDLLNDTIMDDDDQSTSSSSSWFWRRKSSAPLSESAEDDMDDTLALNETSADDDDQSTASSSSWFWRRKSTAPLSETLEGDMEDTLALNETSADGEDQVVEESEPESESSSSWFGWRRKSTPEPPPPIEVESEPEGNATDSSESGEEAPVDDVKTEEEASSSWFGWRKKSSPPLEENVEMAESAEKDTPPVSVGEVDEADASASSVSASNDDDSSSSAAANEEDPCATAREGSSWFSLGRSARKQARQQARNARECAKLKKEQEVGEAQPEAGASSQDSSNESTVVEGPEEEVITESSSWWSWGGGAGKSQERKHARAARHQAQREARVKREQEAREARYTRRQSKLRKIAAEKEAANNNGTSVAQLMDEFDEEEALAANSSGWGWGRRPALKRSRRFREARHLAQSEAKLKKAQEAREARYQFRAAKWRKRDELLMQERNKHPAATEPPVLEATAEDAEVFEDAVSFELDDNSGSGEAAQADVDSAATIEESTKQQGRHNARDARHQAQKEAKAKREEEAREARYARRQSKLRKIAADREAAANNGTTLEEGMDETDEEEEDLEAVSSGWSWGRHGLRHAQRARETRHIAQSEAKLKREQEAREVRYERHAEKWRKRDEQLLAEGKTGPMKVETAAESAETKSSWLGWLWSFSSDTGGGGSQLEEEFKSADAYVDGFEDASSFEHTIEGGSEGGSEAVEADVDKTASKEESTEPKEQSSWLPKRLWGSSSKQEDDAAVDAAEKGHLDSTASDTTGANASDGDVFEDAREYLDEETNAEAANETQTSEEEEAKSTSSLWSKLRGSSQEGGADKEDVPADSPEQDDSVEAAVSAESEIYNSSSPLEVDESDLIDHADSREPGNTDIEWEASAAGKEDSTSSLWAKLRRGGSGTETTEAHERQVTKDTETEGEDESTLNASDSVTRDTASVSDGDQDEIETTVTEDTASPTTAPAPVWQRYGKPSPSADETVKEQPSSVTDESDILDAEDEQPLHDVNSETTTEKASTSSTGARTAADSDDDLIDFDEPQSPEPEFLQDKPSGVSSMPSASAEPDEVSAPDGQADSIHTQQKASATSGDSFDGSAEIGSQEDEAIPADTGDSNDAGNTESWSLRGSLSSWVFGEKSKEGVVESSPLEEDAIPADTGNSKGAESTESWSLRGSLSSWVFGDKSREGTVEESEELSTTAKEAAEVAKESQQSTDEAPKDGSIESKQEASLPGSPGSVVDERETDVTKEQFIETDTQSVESTKSFSGLVDKLTSFVIGPASNDEEANMESTDGETEQSASQRDLDAESELLLGSKEEVAEKSDEAKGDIDLDEEGVPTKGTPEEKEAPIDSASDEQDGGTVGEDERETTEDIAEEKEVPMAAEEQSGVTVREDEKEPTEDTPEESKSLNEGEKSEAAEAFSSAGVEETEAKKSVGEKEEAQVFLPTDSAALSEKGKEDADVKTAEAPIATEKEERSEEIVKAKEVHPDLEQELPVAEANESKAWALFKMVIVAWYNSGFALESTLLVTGMYFYFGRRS